jgi:DNA excision repair protein ERCC-2
MRPGQKEIIDAVAEAIDSRGRLFLHAPTGIGKTMAVLYPALRSLASGDVSRLFYLTAKGTGKKAATDTLAVLVSAGLRARYLVLTAREKICPHPPCDPATCDLATGYYDRFKDALREADGEVAFLPETITALAARHRLCPFELSLDLSIGADCIICDYNYVFDPRAFLRRYFLARGDYLFLVDEAHNLPDRGRDMFSAQVTKRQVLDARRGLSRDGVEGALYRQLGRANQWFLDAARRLGEQPAEVAAAVPSDLLEVISETTQEIEGFLASRPGHPKRPELLDLYYSAAGMLRVAELFNERYVFSLAPVGGRNVMARLYCVDPSEQLEQGLNRGRAAVLFSGTLLPMDYFRRLCNRRPDARELMLPSPFPAANRRVLIHASVATRYRKRSGSAGQIAELVHAVASSQAGNYLVFFPSFAYLSLVYAAYAALSGSTVPLVQARSMDDAARATFLGRFADSQEAPVLAFGVMGGVFGESVDLPGELLTGAVVVGPGLPQVCLEREVIRQYHDGQDESGFYYAYVYPGLNRVLQAAGRVIRSETDRGIAVFVGERFAQEPYRRIIEEAWPGVYATETPDELEGALRLFWQEPT